MGHSKEPRKSNSFLYREICFDFFKIKLNDYPLLIRVNSVHFGCDYLFMDYECCLKLLFGELSYAIGFVFHI